MDRAIAKVRPGATTVLDVCCHGGGFGISAAAAGAAAVTGVDSSAPALALAGTNAALNGVEDRVRWVRADALRFMREAAGGGLAWDLVVLDPPKLAPTRAALGPALRKYRSLNAAALRCVTDGGLLMTCSCSGAVAQAPPLPAGGTGFTTMLRAAAADAGVRVTVLRVAGAGPDHPLDPAHAEGAYLTNVLVRVDRL
jgi:23S rRNA G2069 N7-methylase RlmK/C1962 C5-methylase RlmI